MKKSKFLQPLLFMLLLMFSVPFAKGQDTVKIAYNKPVTSLQFLKENTDTEIEADSLIRFARKYLKRPYKMGTSGEKSFDCSGFSSFVYSKFGYSLERTAQGQANKNGVEIPRDSLKKGDLIFFKGRNARQNRVGHVGIVYEVSDDGSFSFIHASCKYGVTITEGNKEYYRTRFVKAKRILDEEDIENLDFSPATSKKEPTT